MKVIPVIDLKNGAVVRGVGGRRDEYRSVESTIAADASPATVARGLVETIGSRFVYVADLDAIAGEAFDAISYTAIHSSGLEIWLDAGIGTETRARHLQAHPECGDRINRVIIGLESLRRPAALVDIVGVVGTDHCVFSLDLKHGVPITSCAEWQSSDEKPLDDVIVEIIGAVLDAGLRQMIVLDLAGVGEDAGVRALDVCRRAARIADSRGVSLDLISGGGVRHADDLLAMSDAGCTAALVASALHDGRITTADIARLSV